MYVHKYDKIVRKKQKKALKIRKDKTKLKGEYQIKSTKSDLLLPLTLRK
jgi:hypothetical protein